MKLLRALFLIGDLYFRRTLFEFLHISFVLTVVGYFFLLVPYRVNAELWPVILPLIIVLLYLLVRIVITYWIARKYLSIETATLSDINNGIVTAPESLNLRHNYADEVRLIAEVENGSINQVIFNFYNSTKVGDYLAKQVYYTVIKIRLIRVLPHVLFDSKISHGRQFKFQYLKSQRISVQGPFDRHFDTYVPESYHIDTLSFITPEAMEAIVQASDYDVEISGNHLYLYGPLLDEEDIRKMYKKALRLANHINDNIDNYRDDRLSGEDRKNSITPFARTLLRSSIKSDVGAIVSGVFIILTVFGSITHSGEDTPYANFLMYGFMIFITCFYNSYKIRRDNKKALESLYFKSKIERISKP